MKLQSTHRIARIIIAAAILSLFIVDFARAQVLFSSGSPYTQNFDTFSSTGNATWTDNSTLLGWYAQFKTNVSITTLTFGTGSSTTGALYDFGVAGTDPVTDRALGSVASGTTGMLSYGVRFQNDTAQTITNITIAYNGEQWRSGATETIINSLYFTYQVSSSAITSADAASSASNSATWTGGHSNGAKAAETAVASLTASFWQQAHPVFDPLAFLHLAVGKAHEDVAALGKGLPLEQRPRATCAVFLVQDSSAWWVHVGDSRIYHIRNGELVTRTRDHSHVEQLLRDGVITEAEVHRHPMRNFVECCLGGDPMLTEMSIAPRRPLQRGDVLLACTDGLWANLADAEVAAFWRAGGPIRDILHQICVRAVHASAPHSDNTSAAALRWLA